MTPETFAADAAAICAALDAARARRLATDRRARLNFAIAIHAAAGNDMACRIEESTHVR